MIIDLILNRKDFEQDYPGDFIDKIVIGILLMPFACICTFLSDTMFGSSKKRRRR